MGFPGGSEVKASDCNVGGLGLIPRLGRSPGEGNGNLLQYSCLKNYGVMQFVMTFASPGFPDNSVGKESACNAGDPSSIPESERSAGEGIGYPLQYSWASLVAQLVKNLPANVGNLGSIHGWGRSPGGLLKIP